MYWFQQATITLASHILCHVKISCLTCTRNKQGQFLLYASGQGQTLITLQTSRVGWGTALCTNKPFRNILQQHNSLDWNPPWLRPYLRIKYTNDQEMSIKMQYSLVLLWDPSHLHAIQLPGIKLLPVGLVCAPSRLYLISHRRPFVSLSFDSRKLNPHSDWSYVSTDWPWHTTQNTKQSRQPS